MNISTRSNAALLLSMALALALFYRAGPLSAVYITQISLAGLALFGVLALLRPDLALVFVPLTAPLHRIPLVLPGLRATTVALQLHEMILLVVVAAAIANTAARASWRPRQIATGRLLYYTPHLLLLLAGAIGVALAVERSQALRELRWLVIEPLLFYALWRWLPAPQLGAAEPLNATQWRVLLGFIAAGAAVALVGLLQFAGVDLVQLLFGWKETGGFTDNLVQDSGLARATSVYTHPNNLGLALGRVWPLAFVLGLAAWLAVPRRRVPAWLFGFATLACAGGILVSFSRGAWLGMCAAAAMLALPLLHRRLGSRAAPAILLFGTLALALAGVGLSLRGDLSAGSTPVRLLLWGESLKYLAAHPLGLGMGQFYFYHNPEFGRSLIDPALSATSERFASHPHNMLLDTLLRVGPLGLAAFVWLLARFFRQSFAAQARAGVPALLALGALAAMTATLVHGMVDQFYFVTDLAFAFWLLIALVEPAPARPERQAIQSATPLPARKQAERAVL